MATRSDRSGLGALRVALACSAGAAFLAMLATPSDAAPRRYGNSYWGGYSSNRGQATTGSVKKSEAKAPEGFGEMPKGPLQIVVSVGSQKVTLYSNGVRVAEGPVSTGTASHPTPLGVFSVIEKDRHHRSNIYSGAPMPYMQRVTWSGIALHEGALPGYPASHGCIRLPRDFAAKLWPTTKLGARVIVARPNLAPADFAHPKLFTPKQKPAAPQLAMDEHPIKVAEATIAPQAGATAVDAAPDSGSASSTRTPAQANGDGKDASPVAATDEAVQATGTVTAPGNELRPSIEVPKTTQTPKPTETAPAAAETQSAATQPSSDEPEKPTPALDDPPKPQAPRMKKADHPQKRYGQVAVFVSRKEKKIFVRQGFIPVFEMPIVIERPEVPLGTHVFTAMEVTDGGTGMRWNLVTVPNDLSKTPEPANNKRRLAQSAKPPVQAAKPPPVVHPESTPAEALHRIQFPKEAVDRISELLVPGSSLVVSDEGLGRETGRYTEFIVLTR
jgi:hypothetical protein